MDNAISEVLMLAGPVKTDRLQAARNLQWDMLSRGQSNQVWWWKGTRSV